MKKLNSMVLAIALASQSFAVSVDFYDEQQNNPSATGIRLRINNDSNVPINNAKLRYYFHRTSLPYVVDGYYIPNATLSTNNVNDTLAYLELDIPSVPAGYFPDIAGFSLALHNNDWSSRDKSRDYSYQTSSMLTENMKVVLLSGENILFGESPIAQTVLEPGILKISGLKFSDSAWLEIKNVGASTVALSDYRLVNANDSVFSLGNDSLAVNEVLRICQNQAACGEASKTLVNSVFGWDSIGEAILKKDSAMASYVAWGEPGFHAAAAVDAGVWTDSLEYFPAESHVQQYNADYIKNTFFRLRPNKSGMDTGDWFSFTSNDNPAETVSVPLPIKTSANQPIIKQIPGDNNVLFSWLPVDGVNSYRVIVRDKNDNDVYNLETQNTSVVLPVAQGNYNWTVIGDDEFKVYDDIDGGKHYDLYNIDIIEANINTKTFNQLKIHEIKARRDSYMLDLQQLDRIDDNWDRPNLESNTVGWYEQERCWAVAIEVMNHYYGGDLLQDEIVFKGKYKPNEPLLSPFRQEGNKTQETIELLKWALNINNLDDLNYNEGTPSYEIVKYAIDHEKLIYISVPQHDMVIYGYVGDADNYAFYYAFAGDNNGNVTTSLNYKEPIDYYFIPNVVRNNVTMSDYRVHIDTDGDGITNFEEEERFQTSPFLADSDDDGIEDKREIYNYTIMAKEADEADYSTYLCIIEDPVENKKYTIPLCFKQPGIRKSADKNINKIYAQLDPDDNGDGIDDGLLNFKEMKKSINIDDMDVPADYTIYAREYAAINDHVKCYNTLSESNSYCKIASADEDVFSYNSPYTPISIGAHAHVGDIDFCNRGLDRTYYPNIRGKSTLRSSAVVHGNINAYVIKGLKSTEYKKYDENFNTANEKFAKTFDVSDFIDMYNGSSVQGEINLHAYSTMINTPSEWPNNFIYLYSTDLPTISESQVKFVQNGETYHLKDGDEFSSLTVQSGGTLIVEPGEMFVDKLLQIDANATIRFAEPGKGTVLHTNGQIIWHTYNSESTSNTQYWINVAKGFKLAHHSSQKFYLEGMWAGTIYAPKAKVVLGQVTKTIYGRVLARDVVVHQFAKVYRVDFKPTDALQVSYAF